MNTPHQKAFEKLKVYIENNLQHPISGTDVETDCPYSYRNMNRIFLAKQGETIGQHIKRLRLEKAGEYLCYSNHSISDICYELNFNDIASFSKAFKKHFGSSPASFRKKQAGKHTPTTKTAQFKNPEIEKLEFDLEELPAFDYIYQEYQGNYEDLTAIYKLWYRFFNQCSKLQLVSDESIFFGEILDDNEISESIFCRYRACLILPHEIPASHQVKTGHHSAQRYVKYKHFGKSDNTDESFQKLYANWDTQIKHEIADRPVLEFYHDLTSTALSLTELYIPIQ